MRVMIGWTGVFETKTLTLTLTVLLLLGSVEMMSYVVS